MASNTMKVRVEQIGEVYYPQYKKFILWYDCLESIAPNMYKPIKFNNLKDAKEYAKTLIPKIHKVEI